MIAAGRAAGGNGTLAAVPRPAPPARRPPPLAAVLGLTLALGLAWWWRVPPWEAPDGIWHWHFASHLADGGGLPVSVEQARDAPWRQEGSQPPLYYALVALAVRGFDRGDADRAVRDNPHAAVGVAASGGNANRVLHPPGERFPWRGTARAARVAGLVSLALALAAVAATHAAARRLLPDRPAVAAAAAATVGLSPATLFFGSQVSNDIAALAAGAVVLWAAARVVDGGPTVGRAAGLGTACGLAVLAKLNGLFLLPVAAAALVGAPRGGGGAARLARPAGAFALALAAVAGWWPARNLWRFGDPTGLPLMWAAMPRRPSPPGLAELLGQLGGVWKSAWAVFGWYNLPAPDAVFVALGAAQALGAAGAAAAAVRRGRRTRQAVGLGALAVASLALGVVLWARVQFPQGRLLFPALPALAVVLAVGWDEVARWLAGRAADASAWARRRAGGGRRDGAGAAGAPHGQAGDAARWPWLVVGLWAALSAWLLAAVAAPAYRPPATVAVGDDVRATFEGGITLHRAAVAPAGDPATPVRPGERLTVDLVWSTTAPISRDLSVFVHLVDGDGLVVAQHDSMPAGGRWPTSDWPLDAGIPDRHAFDLPPSTAAPCDCRVIVGLYDARDGRRVAPLGGGAAVAGAVDDAAAVVDRAVTVGRVVVAAAVGRDGVPSPMRVRFGDRIELVGYALPTRAVRPGATVPLTLYWRATRAVGRDLKVSVQLRRGAAETWGQRDEAPADGARPTSAWRPGEVVVDAQPVAVSADAPPDAYTLFVKVYDPERGGLSVDVFGHELALAPVRVR